MAGHNQSVKDYNQAEIGENLLVDPVNGKVDLQGKSGAVLIVTGAGGRVLPASAPVGTLVYILKYGNEFVTINEVPMLGLQGDMVIAVRSPTGWFYSAKPASGG